MHVLLCLVALILPLVCCATGAAKRQEICPDGKRHYRTTIRHIESGGIGYEDGYTTLDVFFSSDPSQWIVTPFFDARGHLFDNGKWAANAGVGLRALWRNRAYGINTYYDYRNGGHLHSNQIGVGLETLGTLFDFRINGYLPVSTKISAPYDVEFDAFSGHYLLISGKYQSAMKGADAEFGLHFGESESFDFYAAAGPYYFIGNIAPVTWGGKARISGRFKDILTLEISDSYDRTFHNKFQGQISLTFSFGPNSKIKEEGRTCKLANTLNHRMLQPVDRQEIIVINKRRKNSIAIDPATRLPYFFVFVNNTSSSNGTYESPYHSLAQAEQYSSPNDIIYVFPGDGTTRGMNSGIFLKANQKFWGSGINHSLPTTQGMVSIPAQSNTAPMITNTNSETEGNAITLATHNSISGVTITSAINDAIYGTDPQSLEVSCCTIEYASRFAIKTSSSSEAFITVTNNQFFHNVNGISLDLSGTSTVVCLDNSFQQQTSVSNVPLEISAQNNSFVTRIENNLFKDNRTGSIRFSLQEIVSGDILVLNNLISNNNTGFASTLGSSFVILPSGTSNHCSIELMGNTFFQNASNSLYVHTDGAITNLAVTASRNTMSENGGSALVFATSSNNFTLLATENLISNINDNGISVVGGTSFQNATITINNNTITDIGNTQNGIAITQGSAALNFKAQNNIINACEGSGILFYASEFTNMTANILDNLITNCLNAGGNAASGISLDTHLNLTATIANNALSGNLSPGIAIGDFSPGNPTVCLTLTGNSSNTDPGYSLTNPGSGPFRLSPCNVNSLNTGTIHTSGTITRVQSCPSATVCPP